MLYKPLWNVIGGRHPTVDTGADFGVMESIDSLLDLIENALKENYQRIKLKCRPGWDLDMIDGDHWRTWARPRLEGS